MKAQLKENWKIIAKNANDPLSMDVASLHFNNSLMLIKLSTAIIVQLITSRLLNTRRKISKISKYFFFAYLFFNERHDINAKFDSF
jgi:hypothetical protein